MPAAAVTPSTPSATPSSRRAWTGRASSGRSSGRGARRRSMAELNGGHLVARTLKQAGVGHIFTLCGGHILPIYDGCVTEGVEVVDMRHEQAAAHAGDAYARLTRNLGVAIVTAGPGVTDAVTGVANAFSARSPLLLIGGAAPLGLRGLGSLPGVEQGGFLKPITQGAWTGSGTRQIPAVLTPAIRTALTGRPGPVFVEIPVDLLLTQIEDRLAPIPTSYVHRTPAGLAAPALAELARLIGEAERPLVIAGSGVYWDGASAAPAALAERASVPVLMNGAGRGTLPSDHRCAVAAARGFALGQADFVLVLGAPLDFRLGYGRPPTFAENVKVAMIDADPSELGRNRALALGAVGDIDVVLRQLLDALPKGIAERLRSWREAVGTREAEGRRELAGLAAADDVPIAHYRVAAEVARVVTPETIVVGDGGDVLGCAAKYVPLHRAGQWLDPGPFGCLGVGPPFALAAKLLNPGRRVLLIAGDGAFGLNGMDMETAGRVG